MPKTFKMPKMASKRKRYFKILPAKSARKENVAPNDPHDDAFDREFLPPENGRDSSGIIKDVMNEERRLFPSEISPGGPALPESTFTGPVLEDPDDRQDNGLVAPWDNVVPESPCGKVVAPSTTVCTLELPNLSGLRTAERQQVLTHALEVHKMQVQTNLALALQKGALPKGISSQEVPSAGSTDGSVMPLNNPLMTQEINMTFLKLVTRALLEWLKDQTRSFFMTDEEVQAYIKSYPLMRQLLSVHDTQPTTSGFFAQAWFYKGLKAGKGIFPNCFGGKQTWDAKFMMNTCKAASAAWVYFKGAEGLTDHYALGHAKAKQLLQNDAYRQAALQPFDRSSFVAGVARGMSSAAELKDDGYPKAIPVLSIHYLGFFSFKIRNSLLEYTSKVSKQSEGARPLTKGASHELEIKKEIERLRAIGNAYGWDKITTLRVLDV